MADDRTQASRHRLHRRPGADLRPGRPPTTGSVRRLATTSARRWHELERRSTSQLDLSQVVYVRRRHRGRPRRLLASSPFLPGALDLSLLRLLRDRGHPPRPERASRRFSRLGEHGALWLALAGLAARARPPATPALPRSARAVVARLFANIAFKFVVRRRGRSSRICRRCRARSSSLSYPSAHATTSFAAARSLSATLPAAAALCAPRPRWRFASLPRPALPLRHGRRLRARLGRGAAWWRHEGRHRRPAERRQVIALQRADGRAGRRPRRLPVHHARAQRRRRAGSGRASRPRGRDARLERRSCARRSPSTTSPASCEGAHRGEGLGNRSSAKSARPTDRCTSFARTTTPGRPSRGPRRPAT